MRCDNCGSPIEPREVDLGSCTSCGKVFPYVVRAAEKAEIVRRVVAQGGQVQIQGDRLEARPASTPSRPTAQVRAFQWLGMALGVVTTGLTVLVLLRPTPLVTGGLRPTAAPVVSAEAEHVASPPSTLPPPETAASPGQPIASPSSKPSAKAPSATATAKTQTPHGEATVKSVVAKHRGSYARCQEAEVATRPTAPRRYTVAITVGPSGSADWVEVLSESSASMQACLAETTKRIVFPRPEGGSSRTIVVLNL